MKSPIEYEEEGFFPQIFYVIRTYFFRLIGLNSIFLLCCIPVVTIPAALYGLHAVVQRYYRRIYSTTVVRDFFLEFKTDFLRRTGLFMLLLAAPVIIYAVAQFFAEGPLLLVISAIGFLASLMLLTWFVPQLVLLNLDAVQALKNACILALIETKTNFLLMALHAVVLTSVTCLLPLSGFSLIFLPVLHTLLITGLVMPVFKTRLIQNDVKNDNPEATS